MPYIKSVHKNTRNWKPAMNKYKNRTSKKISYLASTINVVCLCLAGSAIPLTIQADENTIYSFDIQDKVVSAALQKFALQTNSEIIFSSDIAKEKYTTSSLKGKYTEQDALATLLAGTGLVVEKTEDNVFLVLAEDDKKDAKKNSVNLRNSKNQDTSVTSHQIQQRKVLEKRGYQGMVEIMVTANKRGPGTSIQDTAMSISAITADAIDKRNLVGMDDYLRTLPGVNMIDRGVGQNAIIIRGISADPAGEGFSVGPTVGVYLGETPITGYALGSTADIKMVDIERIEVLRGPQGTLYGSSSLGGTVRNIPVAPNLSKLTGSLSVGYSDTAEASSGNNHLKGVINIPLIEDKLALRAVGYRFHNSGYIKNIAGSDAATITGASAFNASELAVNQDDIGNSDYEGFRIAALFQPSEKLAATLTYLKQDLEQEGKPESELDLGTYSQTRLQLAGGGDEGLADTIEVVSLTLEYDVSWAMLTSASSWIDEEFRRDTDLSSAFGLPFTQLFSNTADVFTEELRLSTLFDGSFQFVAGLYYEDTESGFKELDYWAGDQTLNFFDSSTALLADVKDSFTLQQKAVFGEVTYNVSEQFTLTAGFRAFEYEKIDTQDRDGIFVGGLSLTTAKVNDSGNTFKLGAAYTTESDNLIYANWSEGFRLGKTLLPLPPQCDSDDDGIYDGTNLSIDNDVTDPDNLETFEVGGKFSLLDGRATFNAALYHSNWDGIPINVTADCGLGTVDNAGEARVQGLELEAVVYVTPALRLEAGVSYVDAELTEDALTLGGVDGDRLPGSPDRSINLGVQYDFSIDGNASYIRSDYAYVGEFYNNLKEAGDAAGGYHQLNVKAGLMVNNIRVDLSVNNLTNADDVTWFDTGLIANRRATVLRPRTIGLNIGYSF